MENTRAARPADLAGVQACVDAAFGPYVAAIGKPPAPMLADYAALIAAGEVYLIEADGAIAGVIVLEPKADHLFVDVLAVRPELQGRGVGRALMGFAEALALDRSTGDVRLYTHVLMTQALAFYRRLDYRETARLVEDGYERVYLGKTLSGG